MKKLDLRVVGLKESTESLILLCDHLVWSCIQSPQTCTLSGDYSLFISNITKSSPQGK